ncbi:hypothetical protein Hypma_010566 [Hypsizygus marmoreus]|uniref:Uncharacterized protein n=1 Tax=Hypsizygus marmoreus TaxID=39966 RepID=A0A369JUC5_HYPMA|nr:hypothetical protein Hypma_010566 [Hypsizygus marmoreus]
MQPEFCDIVPAAPEKRNLGFWSTTGSESSLLKLGFRNYHRNFCIYCFFFLKSFWFLYWLFPLSASAPLADDT